MTLRTWTVLRQIPCDATHSLAHGIEPFGGECDEAFFFLGTNEADLDGDGR